MAHLQTVHGSSMENPENLKKIRIWVWGTIFIVNIEKRIARKLSRIILLHFGLVAFRFHFGRTRKFSFSWFADLADVTMTPKANQF